ncbi:MAG: hypothetical protein PVG66_02010 [Chromatiales bacterium]|jgi:hypothetical protein
MYLADLLNSYGFFPRAATLWKDHNYAELLNDILSRATSSVVSINRIDELQRHCFREFELFEEQIDNKEDLIVFNSISMVSLQNEISPLLSSLRIMQDLTNDLVRKLSGTNIPRSISDTIKKMDRYDLPQELKDLYTKYWGEGGGSKLREYRIADQHYSNIVDHVFLQLSPIRNVLLMFPDNPGAKSKSKYTYNNKICGISVLRIGFDEIQEFIERILEYYEIQPSQHSESISLDQWGDLRPYRRRALGLMYQTKVTQTENNKRNLNISAICFSQLEDGGIESQNMLLSEEMLREINR